MLRFTAFSHGVAIAAATALCAACASQSLQVQDTEQMLIAAGFLQKPANTPQRQQQLATLPPERILSQQIQTGDSETIGYVYADPKVCGCLYVGDPKAYQEFQRMAFQKHLAERQVAAAQMEADAAFDWGMWGPYDYWLGRPVIVAHRGFIR